MAIHPTAAVSARARLGCDVSIGAFCVVEDDVDIGDGCTLAAGSVVKSATTLGEATEVGEGTVLGGLAQHLQRPRRCGRLVIGNRNTLREHVTIHRGLAEGGDTIVGDDNLIMVGVHVGHDSCIGNRTIIANNVMIAGHVTVEDRAYLSGAVGVHQFCRVGSLAMVGGQSHVTKDIPPFVTVDGVSTCVVGLNKIGLRRSGFSREDIAQLSEAYRLIYRSGLPHSEILRRLAVEFPDGPAALYLPFFQSGTRGFTPARRTPPGATIALHEAAATEPMMQSKAG